MIMMPKRGIEFSICTYNRLSYLKKFIAALLPQIVPNETTITVIDNGSIDDTKAYVLDLEKNNFPIRYMQEMNQGLSHARNRAWKESQFEWIFYLDDDCIPAHDLVDQALDLIKEKSIADMYGGIIYPLYETTPPAWLPPDYGSFSMPFERLTLIEKGYVRGGCMMIRPQTLKDMGGFNAELGMKGSVLRYGEEIDLQIRMRKRGYKIAYAPELKTGHFVRTEKLKPRWILSSTYARSRDKMAFAPVPFHLATFNMLRTIASRLVWAPIHLTTIITNKQYNWDNAVLDALTPLAYRSGEFVGTIQNKFLGRKLSKQK